MAERDTHRHVTIDHDKGEVVIENSVEVPLGEDTILQPTGSVSIDTKTGAMTTTWIVA